MSSPSDVKSYITQTPADPGMDLMDAETVAGLSAVISVARSISVAGFEVRLSISMWSLHVLPVQVLVC